MSEETGLQQRTEDELLPDERHREGLDPVTYLEGAFAAITTLGIGSWLGYSLSAEILVVIGGIGLALAIIYEVKYE